MRSVEEGHSAIRDIAVGVFSGDKSRNVVIVVVRFPLLLLVAGRTNTPPTRLRRRTQSCTLLLLRNVIRKQLRSLGHERNLHVPHATGCSCSTSRRNATTTTRLRNLRTFHSHLSQSTFVATHQHLRESVASHRRLMRSRNAAMPLRPDSKEETEAVRAYCRVNECGHAVVRQQEPDAHEQQTDNQTRHRCLAHPSQHRGDERGGANRTTTRAADEHVRTSPQNRSQ